MKEIRYGLFLLATAAMVLGQSACAEADEASLVRSISVSGQGEAAGPPDRARVSVGVQTYAATVTEASQQNQQRIAGIMDALDEHDIPESAIQTSNYQIWPEQRHDPRGGEDARIIGYRVSNTMTVNIADIDKVAAILGAVTNAGANTINGVSFSVADTAALEAEARERAMQNARERAESLAELAGVDLGDVISISMHSGGGHPVPMMGRMAMAEAAPAPGISAGELSVTVNVQVSYAID